MQNFSEGNAEMPSAIGKQDVPPAPVQAIKAVRIFGLINLLLGLYMILGAIAAFQGMNLPGAAAKLVGGVIGIAIVAVGWGTAVVSGAGLLVLSGWGRRLAIVWGKIIVWMLPIAFGLSIAKLSNFLSFSFLVIVVICLYANVVAQNLARADFDPAFEKTAPTEKPETRSSDAATKAAPKQKKQERGIVVGNVVFKCENCGKEYTLSASLVGRKVKCKACDHKFRVPSAS
jgi:DNA-directed RNA polymerase subunit RPC12/RpoP